MIPSRGSVVTDGELSTLALVPLGHTILPPSHNMAKNLNLSLAPNVMEDQREDQSVGMTSRIDSSHDVVDVVENKMSVCENNIYVSERNVSENDGVKKKFVFFRSVRHLR